MARWRRLTGMTPPNATSPLSWAGPPGAVRDLALLVIGGYVAVALLLLAARQAAQPTAEPPVGQCLERWDEGSEWMPHVDCAAPIRASRRNK